MTIVPVIASSLDLLFSHISVVVVVMNVTITTALLTSSSLQHCLIEKYKCWLWRHWIALSKDHRLMLWICWILLGMQRIAYHLLYLVLVNSYCCLFMLAIESVHHTGSLRTYFYIYTCSQLIKANCFLYKLEQVVIRRYYWQFTSIHRRIV